MLLTKILSLFLCFCLILEQGVFAQTIDLSHYFARNSASTVPQSDKFRPLHLRYISYDNQANDFKILLDKGNFFNQQTPKLEEAAQELMKYFFIGLSLPNEKFWVNLRPDSPDNILDPDLEKTDIGRIFLEADLQLKKDASGMTSPQTSEGKAYWDKLYKKAGELFGTENITIPAITRPWIVPAETIIGESPEGAYIYKATLKVMLEEDYLRGRKDEGRGTKTNYTFNDPRLKELNEYSTQLIKEAIIPKLTYKVNTSKRYAQLRQVYYSLVLAQWFKQKYGSLGSVRASGIRPPVNNYLDLIDSGHLTNLTSREPYDKQAYFKQYQKSFKDGEYNLQEPVYTPTGQSIRRYMSGGMLLTKSGSSAVVYPIKEPPQDKAYLLASEAGSPLNSVEETAIELTEALFNPDQENQRLFIWRDKITPEVFKKIVENIERAENLPQENKEIKIRDLIIRILIDTAGLKEEIYYSKDKTQKALFREIINDYIAFANTKAPEDENLFASFFSTQTMPTNESENPESAIILEKIQILKTHISEYKRRFGIRDETGKYYYKESIETIFNIAKDIKTRLRNEEILNEPTLFLYIWDTCLMLYRLSDRDLTRIDDLLERMIYSKPQRDEIWHNEINYLKMKLLTPKTLKTGQEFPYGHALSFNIKIDANNKNLKYIWDKKNKILYIQNSQNSNTKPDIWLQFLGEVNIFYVSWFNEKINEFESSKENISLPENKIIDLAQLTRYEGVKRLLSSSSAAQKEKDSDIANLTTFANKLTKKEWDNIYEEAAKETNGKWVPINNNVYNFETTMPYPIIGFRNNDVFIITNMSTKNKFVLKNSRSAHEARIHKKLFERGIAVPAILSLNDTTDNYILMNFLEGENMAAQLYNSKGFADKLRYLFGVFNNKDTLGNFIKNIKDMDAAHISHNDLDDFKNMLYVGNEIVFIDFHLTKEEDKMPNNAMPLINSLNAWIRGAQIEIENNKNNEYVKKIENYILFTKNMIAQLSSSPAFNNKASDKGGIDFSRPQIISRPVSEFQSLAGSPLTVNPDLDFEGEWRGIQMVFNSGVRPSARRMAEFAVSASASPLNSRRLEDLRGLVTDLLRRDEEDEKPAPADPALKELLAIL